MIKVLVAPDSFKDCMTAPQVIENIRLGLLKVQPDIEVIGKPVSDGGEGLLETLVENLGGSYHETWVKDPLLRPVLAKFCVLNDQITGVIEMAQASGLELLNETERNPLLTSTYGTGQLILKALDAGCTKLIIGIGGSATNDGGAGMAQALGAKLQKKDGQPIPLGGEGLRLLDSIDISGLDGRLAGCQVMVASDVDNPLTGAHGASRIYGPQKGATSEMVELLDDNLKHYASILEKSLGIEVDLVPGSGAAGGLGAGLVAFLDAQLLPGFDIVSQMLELEKEVSAVDLVITAEGKIDRQTQHGKAPFGVARIARKYQKPVFAFGGTIGDPVESLKQLGFTRIFPISKETIPLEESIRRAPQLLQDTAERALRIFIKE